MIKRLVVDDVRVPNFPATVIRDPREALVAIQSEGWDEVWMDVDNDFQRGPQYTWVTDEVRKLCLAQQAPEVGIWILHSANTWGRNQMRKALSRWYPLMAIELYDDLTLRLSGEGHVVDVSVEKGIERQAFRKALA